MLTFSLPSLGPVLCHALMRVRCHLIVTSRLTPSPIVPVFVCFRARRGLVGLRLHQSRPSLLPSSSPGLVCLATAAVLFVDLQRCPSLPPLLAGGSSLRSRRLVCRAANSSIAAVHLPL